MRTLCSSVLFRHWLLHPACSRCISNCMKKKRTSFLSKISLRFWVLLWISVGSWPSSVSKSAMIAGVTGLEWCPLTRTSSSESAESMLPRAVAAAACRWILRRSLTASLWACCCCRAASLASSERPDAFPDRLVPQNRSRMDWLIGSLVLFSNFHTTCALRLEIFRMKI